MAWWRGGGQVGEAAGSLLQQAEDDDRVGLLQANEEAEEESGPQKMEAREPRRSGGRGGSGMAFGDALRDLESGRGGSEDEWGDAATGVQVKSDGTARYCRKVRDLLASSCFLADLRLSQCSRPKPDRAHHCSSCGHCVLKMDQ